MTWPVTFWPAFWAEAAQIPQISSRWTVSSITASTRCLRRRFTMKSKSTVKLESPSSYTIDLAPNPKMEDHSELFSTWTFTKMRRTLKHFGPISITDSSLLTDKTKYKNQHFFIIWRLKVASAEINCQHFSLLLT